MMMMMMMMMVMMVMVMMMMIDDGGDADADADADAAAAADDDDDTKMLWNRWIITYRQNIELILTFSDWLKDRGLGLQFEEYPVDVLNAKLRTFFAELRNGKVEAYSKISLVNIRAGLNRHLTSPPFNRALNLMHDREFQGSNQVFYGNMRTLRQAWLDWNRHKDAVTENDMRKMYSSGVLGIDNPVSLQHKVYVEVALHFCRRGREGLRELNKNSFC